MTAFLDFLIGHRKIDFVCRQPVGYLHRIGCHQTELRAIIPFGKFRFVFFHIRQPIVTGNVRRIRELEVQQMAESIVRFEQELLHQVVLHISGTGLMPVFGITD